MFNIDWAQYYAEHKDTINTGLKCALVLIVGLPLISLISRGITGSLKSRLSPQGSMVARKAISYLGYLILVFTLLGQLGFDMKTFLGAAGVAGVAIGFASQTSLSNIISGLFLIVERPFQVDDLIEIDGSIGTVESIDLLSMTIRTFDNRSVRLPNETIVKSKVTNITKHPIRRIDIEVGVSYSDDLETVFEVLKCAALSVPLVLRSPEPQVFFTGFGNSSQNFKVGCWCLKDDFVEIRNDVPVAIRKHFDAAGIEIPYPHVTLATGKAGAYEELKMSSDA